MNISFNCSWAAFSLLKHRDDNFADNILQYLYLPNETEPLQTYIVIYNYLIQFGSSWFKKLEDWKQQHRLIFEIDGLFRTYFHFLESNNYNLIIIDNNWKETAKNMYKYLHSFWIESYGIDWTKLNEALLMCNTLSNNTIKLTRDTGHNYNVIRYSADNNITTYDVVV